MNYNKVILFGTAMALCTIACKKEIKEEAAAPEPVPQEQIEAASEKLNKWFETQFQEDVDDSPMFQTYLGIKTADYGKWDDISPEKEVKDLEKVKARLNYLMDSVQVAHLDKSTALSYRMLKDDLEHELADFKYRFHDYPVNQMFGTHSEVPSFLINMHSVDDKKDAEAYISRLKGIPAMFDQLIANLKLREQKGILPPKFVFPKVIEASKNLLKGTPFEDSKEESTLLADFKTKVAALELTNNEKQVLNKDAEKALKESMKPAYDKLVAFLSAQAERATQENGVWKFPEGEAFFNNRLQRITTTNMTSEEIHQLGLSEVERIHNEMKAIMEQVAFKGTLQDFFKFMKEDPQFYYANDKEGKAKYLEGAVALIDTMKVKLDALFMTKPKADIVVKAVEPFREKSAGKAFYQRGTPDGSRPGKYYANLYDMKTMPIYQMEALAYHEGIPGHHMQISIAQELEGIPKFRKFGGYTAYVEGWGLYTEFLPKEIGLYQDPYSDFGRLAMELWRACRLVVDTGIHKKKWTREQGIKYYVDNTPDPEEDAIRMVERHIVMPGQATAYKIGMLKILELRKNAKAELGDQFDIREFHDVVLTNGAVPLTILEELVAEWVASKNEATKEVATLE